MGNISQTTFSNVYSSMKMCEFQLKFILRGQINNILALVQILARRHPQATSHCRNQWYPITSIGYVVMGYWFYWYHMALRSLALRNLVIIGSHNEVLHVWMFGNKSLPEPMLAYCQLDTQEPNSIKFDANYNNHDDINTRKIMHLKISSSKWQPFFFQASLG